MHMVSKLLNLRSLLRALLVWSVSALLLLILSAAILSSINSGSRILAYLSSAISLLSSFAATISAVKSGGKNRMLTAVICATFISLVLLLLGFVISRSGLSPDGILSVVMFTFSGALLGGFAAPIGVKKVRKNVKRKRGK